MGRDEGGTVGQREMNTQRGMQDPRAQEGRVEKGGYIGAGKEGQGGDTEARATTQEDQNMKADP